MIQNNDRFKGLEHLIGNTPLIAIKLQYKGENRVIYAKSENLNMTGSIKDRMALYILERAYKENKIKADDKIVEATSGNTGISFAAIGRSLGHPVTIFMPDWMSRERVDLIQSLGAEIVPVTREKGGFLGSIQLAEELAKKEDGVFLPSQFSNEANILAHEMTTGPEIWWQLHFCSLIPNAFVAGVGTGGTVMGVGRFFKAKDPRIKIFPMEPTESPTMSTGHKIGQHRIQGISDEFIPSIVEFDNLDEIIQVNDGDAILMAQKISAQLGLAIGISSGANFIGALKAQNKLGAESIIVTVFPDDNKKYLSTDLLREEPLKKGYLSPDIKLIDFHAYKRVCHTCCDFPTCTERLSKESS